MYVLGQVYGEFFGSRLAFVSRNCQYFGERGFPGWTHTHVKRTNHS